jgi:outer membrane protein with beta-barrel domain
MSGLKFAINFCVFLLFLLTSHEFVIAQSDERKIEVGVQLSASGAVTGPLFGNVTSVGGGGRVTFDLTKALAIEGELNYFPSSGFDNVRRFQGQFGVKSGWRFDSFGVYGKVRPGFINTKYSFRTFCSPPICPPGTACALLPCFPSNFNVSDTRASLDVGGVFEFYPLKQMTVRFDVGDTIVNRSFGTHNFQLSAGVGFRF